MVQSHHSLTLRLYLLWFLVCLVLPVSSLIVNDEFGTYMNPNPRKIPQCQANDLVKLSSCCDDLLHQLDQCKPDDLACECCALQLINQDCYHLCPGNPLTNFLTVLLLDCSQLSDVNACSLPFKKTDESTVVSKKKGSKSVDQVLEEDEKFDASLKSKVFNKIDGLKEHVLQEQFIKKKIKLVIDKEVTPVQNYSNISNISVVQELSKSSDALSYLHSVNRVIFAILISIVIIAMY